MNTHTEKSTATSSAETQTPTKDIPLSIDASSQAQAPEHAEAAVDKATSPKEAKPRQKQARRRSGGRKNSTTEKNKAETDGSKSAAAQNSKTPQDSRRRPRRERTQTENLSNVLTIGTRLPMLQYVAIVKNVLNLNKHSDLLLQGFGHQGMARLTQCVNVLATWGYITVMRIKTRPEPALTITVKRGNDFQKNYDEFAAVQRTRKEERERVKAEKDAEKAAPKDDATHEQVAQPASTEDKEGSPSTAHVEAPVSNALTEEQTKA